MTGTLITALGHPVRREVLRVLHASDAPMSAVRMSRVLDGTSQRLSYHFATLAKLNALRLHSEREARGAKEKLFASAVSNHVAVLAALADTKEEDSCVRDGTSC